MVCVAALPGGATLMALNARPRGRLDDPLGCMWTLQAATGLP